MPIWPTNQWPNWIWSRTIPLTHNLEHWFSFRSFTLAEGHSSTVLWIGLSQPFLLGIMCWLEITWQQLCTQGSSNILGVRGRRARRWKCIPGLFTLRLQTKSEDNISQPSWENRKLGHKWVGKLAAGTRDNYVPLPLDARLSRRGGKTKGRAMNGTSFPMASDLILPCWFKMVFNSRNFI